MGHRRRVAAGLVAMGSVAGFLYANFILDWMLRGFGSMGAVISELEAPGQPNASLLRVSDVVCALLVLALTSAVLSALPANGWRRVFGWSILAFAAGAVLSAVFVWPCGPDEACGSTDDWIRIGVHAATSIVSEVGLFASVLAARQSTRGVGPEWFRLAAFWIFWLGGVVAMTLFALSYGFQNVLDVEAFDAIPGWVVGAFQRVHITCGGLWMVLLGAYAAAGRGPGTGAGLPAPRDA